MPSIGQYSEVRLVAGGMRLWKTSHSSEESGVITGVYMRNTITGEKSLDNIITQATGQKHYVKSYPAGDGGVHQGRGNYLFGCQYTPSNE